MQKFNLLIILQNVKRFHFTKLCVFHCSTLSLQERLRTEIPEESENISIFKVPGNLRQVEAKAYDPNIISIGPYHQGKAHLQAMEKVKWQFFRRLFCPSSQGIEEKLEGVIEAMKGLEPEARSYYSEDVKMSRKKFVEMMIIDGCFVVELFRDLEKSEGKYEPDGEKIELEKKLALEKLEGKYEPDGQKLALERSEGKYEPDGEILEMETKLALEKPVFAHGQRFLKRWMLPILRNDLMMLENQLPLLVLRELFRLTNGIQATSPCSSIEKLALKFFSPLMPGAAESPQQSDSDYSRNDAKHFLDLFRSSILPKEIKREKEPYLFRSMVELKEAGIKIRTGSENIRPLDIKFESGVLKIPPFRIDDYRCTLYRNLVAFEQCYKACQPDVTRYLFFLDGLINSAKDIELLHYAGVLQHSLGSNKHVARIVNKLCREVSRDIEDSYLSDVVRSLEDYCNEPWHRYRASLVHNYFTNLWVTVSTGIAAILVYFAALQTCCDLAESHDSLHEFGFWTLVIESFIIPFPQSLIVTGLVSQFDEYQEFIWLYC
ncbi:UPF0481 protein At3g47200-like [Olea europaea var. sylvestris]|uniref:UPF0481 protein At3g47200-like n=1 Tax=Olea europaea var. sylvestris TaxID=158386 RepID=UPI000C1D4605|nr:UPF0481 protein At3g47200-like [Olea europaea var. sylvestris]